MIVIVIVIRDKIPVLRVVNLRIKIAALAGSEKTDNSVDIKSSKNVVKTWRRFRLESESANPLSAE